MPRIKLWNGAEIDANENKARLLVKMGKATVCDPSGEPNVLASEQSDEATQEPNAAAEPAADAPAYTMKTVTKQPAKKAARKTPAKKAIPREYQTRDLRAPK